MLKEIINACSKMKTNVVLLLIAFILGFASAFFNDLNVSNDLREQNKELKNSILINRDILKQIETIDSLQIAKVDSLVSSKIAHLNQRIEQQNRIIQALLNHLESDN